MEPNKKKIKKEKECNREVLIEFANRLNITPADLIKSDKSMIICEIRQLYCKLRCEIHNQKRETVGLEINRHISSVGRSLKRINNLLSYEDERVVAIWELVKDIPNEKDENSLKVNTTICPLKAGIACEPLLQRFGCIFFLRNQHKQCL